MTNQEIKDKIDKNNARFKELVENNKDNFILNKEINKLREENISLQSQCAHEFEDGYCKWCYKKEEE